jgi:riboflavin synthase alpha subunit
VIAIIPHTFDVTNFKYLKRGQGVNLEFDIIAKYVQQMLQKIVLPQAVNSPDRSSTLREKRLRQMGY